MDMREAEQYFKSYMGNGYYMCLDDVAYYEEFCALHISEALKEQWRNELLCDYLSRVEVLSEDTWIHHSNVIELLRATTKNRRKHMTRLLDAMEAFPALDQRQRILVIESMAGPEDKHSIGGVALFRLFRDLMPRMKAVMERIIGTFDPAQAEAKSPYGVPFDRERYDRAVNSYCASLSAPLVDNHWQGGLSADWKRYLWTVFIVCLAIVILLCFDNH